MRYPALLVVLVRCTERTSAAGSKQWQCFCSLQWRGCNKHDKLPNQKLFLAASWRSPESNGDPSSTCREVYLEATQNEMPEMPEVPTKFTPAIILKAGSRPIPEIDLTPN
ncbi:hypothetical protein B0H16DRAFT_1462000 [Mycena metata]|uniref:Secreted protein n=1 Tax=Mycena metata TaxID=1033252 RepID=A0AAD7N667_9AGAR|nr:hypothetical protein B0H16DRAFT_1462000 [Mycena metata]